MSDVITAVRKRLSHGEPVEGDLSWCRQRLRALNEWPVPLSIEQMGELRQVQEWIREYSE